MAADLAYKDQANGDVDAAETREWLESLDGVLQTGGPARASFLLSELKHKAQRQGVEVPFTANTPYVNTIPADRQAPYPGSREIERSRSRTIEPRAPSSRAPPCSQARPD